MRKAQGLPEPAGMPSSTPAPLRLWPAGDAPASRRHSATAAAAFSVVPLTSLPYSPFPGHVRGLPPAHGALPPSLSPVVPQPPFLQGLGAPIPAAQPEPVSSGYPGPRRGARRPAGLSHGPHWCLWTRVPHGGEPGPQSWLSSAAPLPLNRRKTSVPQPHSPSPQAPSPAPLPPARSLPMGSPTSGSHLAWLLGTVLASPFPTPTCTTAFSPPLLRFEATIELAPRDLGHPGA